MLLRNLGHSGLRVSSIGLGCVTFGREIDQSASFAVLDYARTAGITLLDTAEAYSQGASELVLGHWMADRRCRAELTIATKVSGPLTAKRIASSAEESLVRLQTDSIDIFQLHSWDAETPLEETLEALTKLVVSGKVRCLGCSNFAAWQLAKALLWAKANEQARLECVQPPYNLVQREVESELLPMCADQGLGVITYSPLAAGFLTGKYQPSGVIPRGSRFDVVPAHQSIYFTPHAFTMLAQLEKLSLAHGRSTAELSLSWVLRRPNVSSVLIGARSSLQIDQAIAAQQLELPDSVWSQLNSL